MDDTRDIEPIASDEHDLAAAACEACACTPARQSVGQGYAVGAGVGLRGARTHSSQAIPEISWVAAAGLSTEAASQCREEQADGGGLHGRDRGHRDKLWLRPPRAIPPASIPARLWGNALRHQATRARPGRRCHGDQTARVSRGRGCRILAATDRVAREALTVDPAAANRDVAGVP